MSQSVKIRNIYNTCSIQLLCIHVVVSLFTFRDVQTHEQARMSERKLGCVNSATRCLYMHESEYRVCNSATWDNIQRGS